MEAFPREYPKHPNMNFSILQEFSKEREWYVTIRDALSTIRDDGWTIALYLKQKTLSNEFKQLHHQIIWKISTSLDLYEPMHPTT